MSEATVHKLRGRERTVGYWSVLDSALAAEKLAGVGYDFIVLDGQHGATDFRGWLAGLGPLRGTGTAGFVRVPAARAEYIGQALDAGASAVIVPMVDTAAEATAIVRASMYPPHGNRSFGPMRTQPADGRELSQRDGQVLRIVMIETAQGLGGVEEICAVNGLDAVFVGPIDLSLAVGAKFPGDPEAAAAFEAALVRIRAAADAAGIASGIYVGSGEDAARRLEEGFTFVAVANDLSHMLEAAASHLATARADLPRQIVGGGAAY